MSPRNVLVTGANRGIGLGFVKAYLADKSVKNLFATCRNKEKSKELLDLSSDSRLHVHVCDVDNDAQVVDLRDKVASVVGSEGLNVLVNNAGIFNEYKMEDTPNRAEINKMLNTNVVSVLCLTQYFIPLLRQSGSTGFTSDHAVVNISSGLGSITDNTTGSSFKGSAVYRLSKAALNSLSRTLAVDLKKDRILVVAFSPGWVQTDMGGPQAQLSVEYSVSSMLSSLAQMNEEHSGGFFKATGEVYPY